MLCIFTLLLLLKLFSWLAVTVPFSKVDELPRMTSTPSGLSSWRCYQADGWSTRTEHQGSTILSSGWSHIPRAKGGGSSTWWIPVSRASTRLIKLEGQPISLSIPGSRSQAQAWDEWCSEGTGAGKHPEWSSLSPSWKLGFEDSNRCEGWLAYTGPSASPLFASRFIKPLCIHFYVTRRSWIFFLHIELYSSSVCLKQLLIQPNSCSAKSYFW